MHCRDLIELAAWVAVHAVELKSSHRFSASALEQYLTASKMRLEGWSKAIKDFLHAQQPAAGSATDAAEVIAWQSVRPLLEEVLASEVLTRVWTAVASTHDRRRSNAAVEPVVRSVYIGHLEARNRALNMLVYGRGFSPQEAVDINRLRRRCERWCDMLLGYIVDGDHLEQFAFEPERMQEFARDVQEQTRDSPDSFSWTLTLSSLRAAFQESLSEEVPSGALNQQIASSILACFGTSAFASKAPLRSTWLERIELMTSDAEGLVTELLALDA